jgi:hypothetical protein
MIVIPATLYWNMQANILPNAIRVFLIDAARAHAPSSTAARCRPNASHNP